MEMRYSQHQRGALLRQLADEVFDIVIIGGGINGAAIARDAALRGCRVALLEQHDFASGTSSRSSRLIHGGLRYLEHGEIGLVFESVSERAMLARLARHLVRPLPFMVPVYRHDEYPLVMVNVGLWIYDALALFRNYRIHRHLSRRALVDQVPGIRRADLVGGVRYYDYQTNDARMVMENAIAALRAGATLLSYCRVEGFQYQRRRATAVSARDQLTGRQLTVRGRVFICAAGPWTDQVLATSERREHWLRPSKGVHIVVPREVLSVNDALVIKHPRDQRVLFVLPYHERTVIGTTDTEFRGDPGAVRTTAEDVHFLVEAARHFFPQCGLSGDDVLSTWCGIRPLVAEDEAHSPSAISRDHRIVARSDGITIIAGGKLTTHRRMAAECVDETAAAIGRAGGNLPVERTRTSRLPLPGGEGLATEQHLTALGEALGRVFDPPDLCGPHLASSYGTRARAIANIATTDPSTAQLMIPELPFVWAEVAFAARHEMAITLEDVLLRRTQLFYGATDRGASVAEQVAAVMGAELGWTRAEQQRQVDAYLHVIERNDRWKRRTEAAERRSAFQSNS